MAARKPVDGWATAFNALQASDRARVQIIAAAGILGDLAERQAEAGTVNAAEAHEWMKSLVLQLFSQLPEVRQALAFQADLDRSRSMSQQQLAAERVAYDRAFAWMKEVDQ